jgi:hypothetical protein
MPVFLASTVRQRPTTQTERRTFGPLPPPGTMVIPVDCLSNPSVSTHSRSARIVRASGFLTLGAQEVLDRVSRNCNLSRTLTDSRVTKVPPLNCGVFRVLSVSPCRGTVLVWSVLTQFCSEATSA